MILEYEHLDLPNVNIKILKLIKFYVYLFCYVRMLFTLLS